MRVVRVKPSEKHASAVVALSRCDIGLILDALEESLAEYEDGLVPVEEALDVESAERIAHRLAVALYAMDGVQWIAPHRDQPRCPP